MWTITVRFYVTVHVKIMYNDYNGMYHEPRN